MRRSAFTIWELLLVIVIILVVAAVLFPVFRPAREGKPHPCSSMEKQLGLAIIQYTQDNDECLPNIADVPNGKNTWRVVIYPYCKTQAIYQCPDRTTSSDRSLGPDGLPRSYAANYTGNYSGSYSDKGDGVLAGPGSKPVNLTEIASPAKLIVLCEVSRHSTPDYNIDNIVVFNPHNSTLWAGHTGGGNYLLADGHAKWLKPLDTQALWHRNSAVPLTPGAVALLAAAQKRAGM